MSTNSECEFIEQEDGTWIYRLEHYNAPKNAWDWREHADTFGPFKSYPEAKDDLFRNHANPGGYTVYHLPDKEATDYEVT